jgi:adenylylsulfate kinase-like enzyme|tara:strand:- start:3088 stop:3528 length:441 start_codon:yes stop_codon:yes gene_type:complete
MVYWLTGQPSSGKTVLSNELEKELISVGFKPKRIDGDDLRELISNKDYSIKGRVYNVDVAQKIAHYLHNQDEIVIVSLVSPYLDQREEFKEMLGKGIKEFYIHTSEKRERDCYHVKGYQKPINNFLDVDTTEDTIEESLLKILKVL